MGRTVHPEMGPPENAVALMMRFAERTGLTSSREGRRYLWTDAFAVCNFLALARATGDAHYAELALALVDRVHRTLGRHRPDDPRHGWISGLGEREGEVHPTRGGLRIGKPLPERSRSEPFDESLEWDRDGQYFHYLTKWMHALHQASRFSGRPELLAWARELARAARAAFCYGPPGHGRRMYWKMAIDLQRPLVRSMGQHDPLDGYLTCLELEKSRSKTAPDLRPEIADFASMVLGLKLATADPLGIGGLLTDAYRAEQLREKGTLHDGALVDSLLRAALVGLARYDHVSERHALAEHRLAFRELGLTIGLRAAALLRGARAGRPSSEANAVLDAISGYDGLRAQIETFWLDPEQQRSSSWLEHQDINEVMLATSQLPGGLLRLDATG